MNDNPLLKTPGEMINEAREAQDLTLAQLSERTKIPPPVLASLELDEYHKISGPLYIKSFLQTCATDLGLDPQVVLSQYNKISGEQKSAGPGSEMVWGEEEVKVTRVGFPWLPAIMVAGVVAILIGLLLFAMRGCRNDGGEQEEVTRETVVPTVSEKISGDSGAEDPAVDGDQHRESMMSSNTEAELRQIAEDVSVSTSDATGAKPVTAFTISDTLASGWLLSPEVTPVQQDVPTSTQTAADPPVEATPVETAPVKVAVPPAVDDHAVKDVPVSESGTVARDEPTTGTVSETATVISTTSSSWPLVLSISCDAPQRILVKRDGDREFSEVRWPAEPGNPPALPEAGFAAGLAYGQGDRLVVFWGAEDHFSLKLAKVRGVEVAINGQVWDVSRLKPGQELILDSHAAGAETRR